MVRKDILTEEGYGILRQRLSDLLTKGHSPMVLYVEEGWRSFVVEEALQRARMEADGLPLQAIPEETFTFTKTEMESVAVTVKADPKASDLKEAVLTKSGITASVKEG